LARCYLRDLRLVRRDDDRLVDAFDAFEIAQSLRYCAPSIAEKFLARVDECRSVAQPRTATSPARPTNKRRLGLQRPEPSRQSRRSLSTDLDVDAGSRPSDLHTRVAIPIAALLDNHIAIAGAAAANRDIAVAIALDALLVAERSNAVLVADALGARRNRDQRGACYGNRKDERMGCSHLRIPFLGFALRETRENECRSGRVIEDDGNPQFQNTVPSTLFDPRRAVLADHLMAFRIAGFAPAQDDEMNAR
jgi:hypothetical protein